jgi:hypothetical protein
MGRAGKLTAGIAAILGAGCSVLLDPSKFLPEDAPTCADCTDGAPQGDGDRTSDGGGGDEHDGGGGTDGGSNGDSGPLTGFCGTLAVKPTFCRDFDDGNAFNADFTVDQTTGAELLANGDASKSPPSSLSAAVTTNGAHAFMMRTFAPVTTRVHLAFDLRMDAVLASGNGALVAEILLPAGAAAQHYLRVMVAADHSTIEEWHGTSFDQYVFQGGAPTKSVWGNIDLTLTISPPRLKVLFNNQSVVDAALPGIWGGATPQLSLGLAYVPNAGPWRLRVDNVVFDAL